MFNERVLAFHLHIKVGYVGRYVLLPGYLDAARRLLRSLMLRISWHRTANTLHGPEPYLARRYLWSRPVSDVHRPRSLWKNSWKPALTPLSAWVVPERSNPKVRWGMWQLSPLRYATKEPAASTCPLNSRRWRTWMWSMPCVLRQKNGIPLSHWGGTIKRFFLR